MSRPTKRAKLGKREYDSELSITAQHFQEHADGSSFLSIKVQPPTPLASLIESTLARAAQYLLREITIAAPAPVFTVGWDMERGTNSHLQTLQDKLALLPRNLLDRLVGLVLRLSNTLPSDRQVAVLSLAYLFFNNNLTKLDLSSFACPPLLLSKLVSATSLSHLDLSSNSTLTDSALAKLLASLDNLTHLNVRRSTKVGDLAAIALAGTTHAGLKQVNFSLTSVTIKGLTELLGKCCNLESIKLANVAGLNDKAINKLLADASSVALKAKYILPPLSRCHTLKFRSTSMSDSSLGRILSLTAPNLRSLDISFSECRSLDILNRALMTIPGEWKLAKLVVSGLPLSAATLKAFFQHVAALPPDQRVILRKIKVGSIPNVATGLTGLTDDVLSTLLPSLQVLSLQSISFFHNFGLGKSREPLRTFMQTVGRRCKFLDLTLPLQSHHLEGLLEENEHPDPDLHFDSALETLILDESKIDDTAALYISTLRNLESLHISGTKVSTEGMSLIMAGCPLLEVVNLTSCRGIPVRQRRDWFECWRRGEVETT